MADHKQKSAEALADSLISSGATQAWNFGPELVREEKPVDLPRDFDLLSIRDEALEPRTAIGQIGRLHYVVIVVDGRRTGYSDGISLANLRQLFLDAGVQTAFNLDGGGSTTLYFCGKVLNRPSGGVEREVTDIVYFK
jgi:exopolysaccharide biosynthesis protein